MIKIGRFMLVDAELYLNWFKAARASIDEGRSFQWIKSRKVEK
jgi:hypothetical protein